MGCPPVPLLLNETWEWSLHSSQLGTCPLPLQLPDQVSERGGDEESGVLGTGQERGRGETQERGQAAWGWCQGGPSYGSWREETPWELVGKRMECGGCGNQELFPWLGPRSEQPDGEARKQRPEARSLQPQRVIGVGPSGLGDLGLGTPGQRDWEQRERQRARPAGGAWPSPFSIQAWRPVTAQQASGVSAKLLADSPEALGEHSGWFLESALPARAQASAAPALQG